MLSQTIFTFLSQFGKLLFLCSFQMVKKPPTPPGAHGRLVIIRNTPKPSKQQKEKTKQLNAKNRAKAKLGDVKFSELKNQWAALESGAYGKDHEKADGLIMALAKLRMTNREICTVFGCGIVLNLPLPLAIFAW